CSATVDPLIITAPVPETVSPPRQLTNSYSPVAEFILSKLPLLSSCRQRSKAGLGRGVPSTSISTLSNNASNPTSVIWLMSPKGEPLSPRSVLRTSTDCQASTP